MDRQLEREHVRSKLDSRGVTTSADIDLGIEAQRKVNELETEEAETELVLQEYAEIISMRGSWSKWLLRVIIAIVAFDFFVVIAIGFGWMRFTQGYIVPVIVGESIVKIIGLAIIVVKFLFDKNAVSNGQD